MAGARERGPGQISVLRELTMRTIRSLSFAVAALVSAASGPALAQQGDAQRGAQAFRACAACHSLEPNKNMTGPSLAGVLGRKAGTLKSFDRYSPALKSAQVTWDAKTLEDWLAEPERVIPGNHMTIPGITDARTRADLIAFLESAAARGAAPPAMAQQGGGMGGMGGMMGGGRVPNLKQATPALRVTAIRYCRTTD